MAKSYDLIVIGGGIAGTMAAEICAKAGIGTLIVDSHNLGGKSGQTSNPKIILAEAAMLSDWNRRMKGKFHDARIDFGWNSAKDYEQEIIRHLPEEKEDHLHSLGIDVVHAMAAFLNASTIKAGSEEISGKNILIATGARHAPLGIPGEELVKTSIDFFSLNTLPKKIIFIGKSYIAFELAHIASRFGSKAVIIHEDEYPLPGFDRDMVIELINASRDAGIEVHSDVIIESISSKDGVVYVRTSKGSFSSDLAVHGAGRVPDLEGLGLEKGNIETRNSGIRVNNFMQSTSNENVYAAGDCTDMGDKLSSVAELEGETAARNIIKPNSKSIDYTAIPKAVFTIPALASVGISEESSRTITNSAYINFMFIPRKAFDPVEYHVNNNLIVLSYCFYLKKHKMLQP